MMSILTSGVTEVPFSKSPALELATVTSKGNTCKTTASRSCACSADMTPATGDSSPSGIVPAVGMTASKTHPQVSGDYFGIMATYFVGDTAYDDRLIIANINTGEYVISHK